MILSKLAIQTRRENGRKLAHSLWSKRIKHLIIQGGEVTFTHVGKEYKYPTLDKAFEKMRELLKMETL